MDKVDVVIPTRDVSRIRPNLLKVLREVSWVQNIIIETSAPLSMARKNGALKCRTDWICFFDDDVEIDDGWFNAAVSKLGSGVVAVSGAYDERNKHVGALMKYIYTLYDPASIASANICNTLILRSALTGYDPPPVFAGEDNLLYRYVLTLGKWVHFYPAHATHRYVIRPKMQFQEGETIGRYGSISSRQFIRNMYHATFRSI